jgi:hypothetical protein
VREEEAWNNGKKTDEEDARPPEGAIDRRTDYKEENLLLGCDLV